MNKGKDSASPKSGKKTSARKSPADSNQSRDSKDRAGSGLEDGDELWDPKNER